MRGAGRRSIPRALSPTAPHRILTPASGGRLTGRRQCRERDPVPFGVIFAWDARRHAPAPSLINANRPSRRVCRLQRRRSARRSSLSARLPGLPSRWPAYFFVRPRGTCSARATVVGFCARPWGRITLQWRNGAPPGAFERRDVSVLGRPASVMRARRTACTYPSAANPHTACCRLRIYMEGNARIYVNGQLPGPPSVHSPPLLI